MNIPVEISADFIVKSIEEYCTTHTCPKGCPFDAIGICTQNNAFNTVFDRYENLKEKNHEI